MSGFEDINPVEFAAWLSQLPEDHPMVVAARAAVEVGDLRRDHRRAMREASHAVCAAMRRMSLGPTFAELQRRRGEAWSATENRWVAVAR